MAGNETTNEVTLNIGELGTSENLNSNSDLLQRYETITQELLQVWGIEKDDKIEIADGILDWKFAEFLLKNESCLNTLKWFVQEVKKKGLTKEAWDNLKKLENFLDNIWNNEKSEKDYKKFFDKLQKPKDLHKMKEQEINRLSMYLAENESEAMNTYQTMKALLDNNPGFYGTGMRLDDIKVFQNVWNEIKKNYEGNETFIEAEYPGYKALTSSSASIQWFLTANKWILSGQWLEWEWDDITVAHIDNKKNSIVNREVIVAKLNELNKQRIDNNKSLIQNAVVNLQLPVADFTKTADWVLKFKWSEFTANDVMLFSDYISNAVTYGDFVVDREKWITINDSRDTIYDKFREKLLADSWVVQEGQSTSSEQATNQWWETKVEQVSSDSEYSVDKKVVKIKDEAVKDKIKGFWFCNDLDGDPVKFDISKVRSYLEDIQGKNRKELQNQESSDRKVTIVAVQTALKYLSTKNGKDKYDVKWIDWIRWNRTIKGIKAFQKENWLKRDGKPWSKTISKIVESLWGVSGSVDNVEKQETEKIFDYDSVKNLDSDKVEQIFADRKTYDSSEEWKNDPSVRVLKLNSISDLTDENAESLSKWEWKIQVNKLLSIAVSEEQENIISKLRKLAPKNGSLTIMTSDDSYYKKLENDLKIESVSSSEVTQVVSGWNGATGWESANPEWASQTSQETSSWDAQISVDVGENHTSIETDNNVSITVGWDNNWSITGATTSVSVDNNSNT